MHVNWTLAAPMILGILTFLGTVLNHFHIRKVHLIVNSRLDQLLKSKGELERAKGRREGVESKRSAK
jgi:hypothetical protein